MGIFSKFEDRMEDTVEGAASKMSKAPISPVQIAKKAEKQMRRETMVGAGKQYAPTLYTVLVNPDDDNRMFGYYPTLAGETETYLSAKAAQEGLVMDGQPLVRFIVDDGLRHGKFDVIAELVAAPIIAQLRDEEMERYGLAPTSAGRAQGGYGYAQQAPQPQAQQVAPQDARSQRKPPLPYVPENEIDRSIDYGEYTFNSEDFEDYRSGSIEPVQVTPAYNDVLSGQASNAAGAVAPFAEAGIAAGAGAVDLGASGPLGSYQDQRERLRRNQQQRNQANQAVRPANTVAFAGGAGQSPDHRNVRARLIDRTYQRPYDLGGTRITMGRDSSNDIKVQDINASRRHAELTLNQQGLWVITDLRSTNGTRVNGVSVASQPLYPGDIVTIGKSDFEFTLM